MASFLVHSSGTTLRNARRNGNSICDCRRRWGATHGFRGRFQLLRVRTGPLGRDALSPSRRLYEPERLRVPLIPIDSRIPSTFKPISSLLFDWGHAGARPYLIGTRDDVRSLSHALRGKCESRYLASYCIYGASVSWAPAPRRGAKWRAQHLKNLNNGVDQRGVAQSAGAHAHLVESEHLEQRFEHSRSD
jgi:hypothetical protein